jgi:hypothetical protein
VVLAAGPLSTSYLAAASRWARQIVESDGRAVSLARATALIVLGAALVFEPALAARTLIVCAGVLLALIGAAQLSTGPSRDRTAPRPGSRSALAVAGAMAGVLAATAVGVALVLPAPRAATAESSAPGEACNGSVALCDRSLNEVAFPGTHNSYSAAEEPGWLFANQRHGIERQLSDGIRALLIDIHYGRRDPENGLVRTDLAAEGSDRNKAAQALGPRGLRAAERLGGRVGQGLPAGGRGVYLCHTLCELGAEPVGEQLALLREFLSANPREVIVLFVEPYVPAEEVERALDQADLLRQAAPLRRDEPLPTLGELVRADTRLVVLAEEDGGARPWYLPGFSFAQDSPLGARRGSEFTCALFRGTADSPLFLLNHWIDAFPPPPSGNERIGSDFLKRRLEQCERSRGLLPNLIAVDFYERTGVVEIARERNARGP